jgi:hypothetical protein
VPRSRMAIVRMHFTPTGSSWINQVERWFGYLTGQMLHRGVHKSVQALEADIRAWVETWNKNPRPFTWTKTAPRRSSIPRPNILRGFKARDASAKLLIALVMTFYMRSHLWDTGDRA